MSIVEKAADKLRQNNAQAAPQPQDRAPPEAQPRDHIEAAGRKLAGRAAAAEPAAGIPRAPVASKPCLNIDFKKLRRAGLLPPVATEEMTAQEYKRIKRPLLTNITDAGASGIANADRFIVTSAFAGEGKTFTSFNLALSLAKERDYSVVLVDGDIPKPKISRALGLKDKQGLSDILADTSVSLGDTILETNVPRLSVLPAGQRHKEAAELLTSQRMMWLMNELGREPNRLVVFDSPPLLLTAEAQALATGVGQVLVVVQAGSTRQHAVMAALSLVATRDKSVSLILNQSTKAHGDYYAGYYGEYDYGHDTGG